MSARLWVVDIAEEDDLADSTSREGWRNILFIYNVDGASWISHQNLIQPT